MANRHLVYEEHGQYSHLTVYNYAENPTDNVGSLHYEFSIVVGQFYKETYSGTLATQGVKDRFDLLDRVMGLYAEKQVEIKTIGIKDGWLTLQ